MASGGGASSKGGASKCKGGMQTITTTKTKERKTSAINDSVVTLRNALFEENGKDKDVTTSLSGLFKQYVKNGLNVDIEFSHKLKKKDLDWAFELTKAHMEAVYEASGYGWDDDDKFRELKEDGTRFLLVRSKENGKLVGFAHFRFTVQGDVMDTMTGEPCLYLWDLQLEAQIQRKGLGKHLLKMLELIAAQQKMKFISVPVQFNHNSALAFVQSCKGYGEDVYLRELLGFVPEEEGFEVFSKQIGARPPPAIVQAAPVAETAAKPSKTENKFGFGAPTPVPTNNIFGFGNPSTTTPKTQKLKTDGSPTTIVAGDSDSALCDDIERLTV